MRVNINAKVSHLPHLSSRNLLATKGMANETNRVKANLSTLGESLDDIEAWLEPLLAQTLPETVVGLETMQQAKLQVVLPYLVYDLVFSA